MERLVKTFKKFDATATGAINTFREVTKKLHDEYDNSKAFEQQYGEAKNVYDETMATAKQAALQEIKVIFADLNEKVKNFVQQPAPADYVATLEAIKAMSDNITEREAEMFFDKFRSNYIASRSISNYLHNLKGYLLPIPTYDRIKANLESLELQAGDFIRNYKAGSYAAALFTTDKNNPWQAEGEKLKNFLNGDVAAIAERPEE